EEVLRQKIKAGLKIREKLRHVSALDNIPDVKGKNIINEIGTDGDTAIIKAKSKTKVLQISELELQNKTTKVPDNLWILLKRFADHGGVLSTSYDDIENVFLDNFRKYISLLRKRLRTIFKIPEDPIVYRRLPESSKRRTKKGYILQFILRDHA